MASPARTSPPTHITVVVKNPANHGSVDYTTSVPASFTVGDLKLRIASELEGNPPPSTQRLIYSGALLRDDAQGLLETLGSADLSAPAVFHLVTSHSNASTPSTSEARKRNPANDAGPSRADAGPLPLRMNPGESHAPSASTSASRSFPDGTPGTVPGTVPGTIPGTIPGTPAAGDPATPGVFSAAPDARDPLAQAAYSAAYAAAFAALSPGTPLPAPPGTPGGHVGVFGFAERANATPRLTGNDAGLPPGWREVVRDGATYYWDTRTDATTYARPPGRWGPGPVGGYADGERGARGGLDAGDERGGLVANGENFGENFGIRPEAAAQFHAALRAIREGDPARAAAAAAAAAAGGRPVRVVQFHVDLKLLLKLATLVCFVGQGASRERLAAYVLAAALLYAAQVGAFNGVLRRALGENVAPGALPPRDRANQRNRDARGDVRGGVADARAAAGLPPRTTPAGPRTTALLPGMREGMPRTWLGEVKVALGGLLASLLPSWEPPELHRHPRERPPARAGAARPAADHPRAD